MRKFHSILTIAGLAAALHAQNCNSPLGSASIITIDPFGATHYVGTPNPLPATYNGFATLFDMNLNGAISITSIDCNLYNEGSVNPDQRGNVAVAEIWTCATTRVGNELVASAWTLAGSGTLTVAGFNENSTATFTTPVAIPAGTYGVAFNVKACNPTLSAASANVANCGPLNPLVILPSVQPNVPLGATDQFMVLSNTVTQRDFTFSGVGASHGCNLRMTYTPAATAGYVQAYGAGCYSKPPSWYQEFPSAVTTPGTFDISNSAIQVVPNGVSYVVAQGTSAITTPLSTSLTTTTPAVGNNDDGLYAAITLPWSFPYANGSTPGSTTQIMIGTNGIVFLSGTATNSFGSYPGVTSWLNDIPSIAPAYGDWDGTGGSGAIGGIYYDVDPSTTKVYITWQSLPEWVPTLPSTGTVTCQLVLHSSGLIEMIYGTVAQATAGAPIITGFTPGNGTANPGNRDLAIAGAVLGFVSGDGSVPAILTMDARPIIGTTPNLVTSNVKPTTLFTVMVVGFSAITPGADLAGFGMPGCSQYVVPAITNGSFFNNSVALTPLAIPNNPSYVGINIRAQSAPFQAGDNPAGILTSNALCVRVGT
ncbi:MAG: hypothetical protein RL148_2921 [Planctomycetota bacterium]